MLEIRNLTKRYIIKSLDGLNLSNPIKYERYYINDNLRIQKKNNKYEKEIKFTYADSYRTDCRYCCWFYLYRS